MKALFIIKTFLCACSFQEKKNIEIIFPGNVILLKVDRYAYLFKKSKQEQSNQSLHCLPFYMYLHLLEAFVYSKAYHNDFYADFRNISGIQKFRSLQYMK